ELAALYRQRVQATVEETLIVNLSTGAESRNYILAALAPLGAESAAARSTNLSGLAATVGTDDAAGVTYAAAEEGVQATPGEAADAAGDEPVVQENLGLRK